MPQILTDVFSSLFLLLFLLALPSFLCTFQLTLDLPHILLLHWHFFVWRVLIHPLENRFVDIYHVQWGCLHSLTQVNTTQYAISNE